MATEGRRYDQPTGPGGGVPGGIPPGGMPVGGQMGPPGPMYGGHGGWGPGYGYGFGGMRRQFPIETKPFFLTSEFAGTLLAIIALGITAAADNSIDSRFFWGFTTIMVAFYVLSRGIAKSGTKSRAWDPREDLIRREGHGAE